MPIRIRNVVPLGRKPHISTHFKVRCSGGHSLSGISCFRYVCAQKDKLTNQHTPLTQGVILLIEDDLEDVELFQIALTQSGCSWKFVSIQFARDAIRYLCRIGQYKDERQFPKPSVVVLDLSLPGISGLDFLLWARGELLGTIPPIIVFSSSELEINRHLAGKFGAKAYFVKSPDLQDTVAMIRNMMSIVRDTATETRL